MRLTLTGTEWHALGLNRDPEAVRWAEGLAKWATEVTITGEGTYELRTMVDDNVLSPKGHRWPIWYYDGHVGIEFLTRRRCCIGTLPQVVLEAMVDKSENDLYGVEL